ncbi:MAG: hypothetical protein HUJ91_06935 [Bacteroidales bacterium]|nr:hypothetical protein [Bacteroidales bacterium]MCF0178387.1 hypothetical protein [Bacteroidales bacterium]
MANKKKYGKAAALLVGGAAVISAIYIMIHRIGLSDKLDFGAGAYYYADIPDFQKMEQAVSYSSTVPMWAHILLFLIWGALMYMLWCHIDNRHT